MGNQICHEIGNETERTKTCHFGLENEETLSVSEGTSPLQIYKAKIFPLTSASKQKLQSNPCESSQCHQLSLKSWDLSSKRTSRESSHETVKLEEIIQHLFIKKFKTKSFDVSNVKIEYGEFINLKHENIKATYNFVSKVGEGAYGKVYKAEKKRSKEIRAIKVIRKDHISMLWEQIEILKSCDHPNIVHLYEMYEFDYHYYAVMEFCDGGSATKYFSSKNKGRKLTENVFKEVTLQMLQSLVYLHDRNIVHKDIKLENVVFLDPEKDSEHISLKIIDFGIAKRIKYKVNKSGKISGTVSYMSPEGFDGWYSPASDIWSLGVMLYFLLSGKHPFKGKDREETIRNIKTKEPTFQQQTWGQFDPQLKNTICRMLNKNFKKRVSAKECLQESWLQEFAFRPRISKVRRASLGITEKLSKYYAENNFVSVIESYLSFIKITQIERREMMEAFQLLDRDKKGVLSIEDLVKAYNFTEFELPDHEIEEILKKIDKNKSGFIDFSEFQTVMYGRKKLFVKESLADAFDYFDSDKSGYIERKELLQLLKECDEDAQILLYQIDENDDEKISKEEFLAYFEELTMTI